MLKKITAVICVVVGIAVVVMGATLREKPANHSVEEKQYMCIAGQWDVPSAKFGADFYTYMYNGTDTIVSELSDIGNAFEEVVEAEDGIYKAVASNIKATDSAIDALYKVGSTIVIAIGLGIFSSGVYACGKSFAFARPAKEKETAPVPDTEKEPDIAENVETESAPENAEEPTEPTPENE